MFNKKHLPFDLQTEVSAVTWKSFIGIRTSLNTASIASDVGCSFPSLHADVHNSLSPLLKRSFCRILVMNFNVIHRPMSTEHVAMASGATEDHD